MSIGTRIKELRTNLQLTQEELAIKLDVTKGAIANYENEVSIPKPEIMYKLFTVLKCDANYLYQDDMNIEESVSLNISEREMVKTYRNMTKEHQDYILQTFDIIKKAEIISEQHSTHLPNTHSVRIAAKGGGVYETLVTDEDRRNALIALAEYEKEKEQE